MGVTCKSWGQRVENLRAVIHNQWKTLWINGSLGKTSPLRAGRPQLPGSLPTGGVVWISVGARNGEMWKISAKSLCQSQFEASGWG